MIRRDIVAYRGICDGVLRVPFLRFPLPGTMRLTLFAFFLLQGLLKLQESYRIFKIFQHHINKYAVASATKAKVTIAFQTIKHHVKGARWRASGPLLTSVTGCWWCRRWMTAGVVAPIEVLLSVGEAAAATVKRRSWSLVACARGPLPSSVALAGRRCWTKPVIGMGRSIGGFGQWNHKREKTNRKPRSKQLETKPTSRICWHRREMVKSPLRHVGYVVLDNLTFFLL